ncbi:MAG: hypothetical protein AB7L76_19180 [Burkholderiaceae bacterium]
MCRGFTIGRELVDKHLLGVVYGESLSPEARAEFDRACRALRAEHGQREAAPAARIQGLSAEIGRLWMCDCQGRGV